MLYFLGALPSNSNKKKEEIQIIKHVGMEYVVYVVETNFTN